MILICSFPSQESGTTLKVKHTLVIKSIEFNSGPYLPLVNVKSPGSIAVKGYTAITILPLVTLGLAITPPPATVRALRTSSLTSVGWLTPAPPLAAAAATASAATMTEAGKGGTGSDLEGLLNYCWLCLVL